MLFYHHHNCHHYFHHHYQNSLCIHIDATSFSFLLSPILPNTLLSRRSKCSLSRLCYTPIELVYFSCHTYFCIECLWAVIDFFTGFFGSKGSHFDNGVLYKKYVYITKVMLHFTLISRSTAMTIRYWKYIHCIYSYN